MSQLFKLVGSGIGLASEAYQASKASRAEQHGESSRSAATASASSHSQITSVPNEPPPEYVEMSQAQANALIARAEAVPVDSKEGFRERIRECEQEFPLAEEEDDEEIWALDEEASPGTEMEDPAESSSPIESKAIADIFLKNHPRPARPVAGARAQLPCAVIIPQRRSKDKKRGFVRAYAPVLADCGIDQTAFLDFVKSFQTASKEDPWLHVVNIAAMAAGIAPSITAMAVSTAVANSFLDRLNDDFFKPHGLYCLIMTYKPESSDSHGSVNMMKSITSTSFFSSWTQKMRVSSGKIYGELELPQAAPLIFPGLDSVASEMGEEGAKKQKRMKKSGKFVADYMDRRAQAKYAGENPGSGLAQTDPKFRSRFADPNHPANSGNLISLVMGGAIDTSRSQGGLGGLLGKLPLGRGGGGGLPGILSDRLGSGSGGIQGALGDRLRQGSQEYGRQNVLQERLGGRGRGTGGRDSGGFVKKIIQKDVLYMMIVNLPSEEEMQAGVQAVANESPR
ncbi:hypothetical protein LSUB1_G001312 [Lachnellula subtilissima]|uniref:Uncharacterized protein n=1 Tax=Lachnellula subtilissima TaxID=602034 RepID=A0A8H8RYE6_9HELO|nr:hypothetical protein LSUB1_G001312 [Lachnellula subtilissima]